MKVLHLCTAARSGGAAIAAFRLHKGLKSLQVDSSLLVNVKGQYDSDVTGPDNNTDKVISRIAPLLDRVPGKFSNHSFDRISSAYFPDRLIQRVRKIQPDILNLHWVNDGFMRIETLPRFRQPIVWTLHDMWPMAGGEHYVGKSTRYIEGYSSKSRPLSESGFDVNRWIWARKKKALEKVKDLFIATPSNWLANCARESQLLRNRRILVLPNGVDHQRFRPMDHDMVRNILGLPVDKKLVLFGAGSATSDKRKGFYLLVEALKKLDETGDSENYELVVFGASSGDDSFGMKTHYLGNLNDEISMALVYAAADVFVAPSLEDNLPNTVLESLSCGTPVVAFDIGGMPDMIEHKENGYLATAFNTTDLAEGLYWVMEDETRWKYLSEKARNTVVQSFTLECCARRYKALYEDILNKSFL
jgi:glycosyltransferase involved in cell wall biosynthesis